MPSICYTPLTQSPTALFIVEETILLVGGLRVCNQEVAVKSCTPRNSKLSSSFTFFPRLLQLTSYRSVKRADVEDAAARWGDQPASHGIKKPGWTKTEKYTSLLRGACLCSPQPQSHQLLEETSEDRTHKPNSYPKTLIASQRNKCSFLKEKAESIQHWNRLSWRSWIMTPPRMDPHPQVIRGPLVKTVFR